MKNKISYAVILFLLIVSAVISWHTYLKVYTQNDAVSVHLFPKQIGDWKSKELALNKEEYAILETKNAFIREYANSKNQKVYLFIVYSENNRKVSHPPEICYTGNGFSIVNRSRDILEGKTKENGGHIPVNRLNLERGPYEQVAFYWFKAGEEFTASYLHQQLILMVHTILRKSTGSALIRLTADFHSPEITEEEAAATIRLFAAEMIPQLDVYLP